MSGEDLEWAAETLVEAERRRCVSRVSRVDTEDAVGKGDNYASDIRRLKMTVVLHSGEVQRRSLIYKAMPETPQRKLMIKNAGIFAIEAKVFTEVLSEMNILLQEKDYHAEILWPEFFGSKRKYEGLLFEDLCVKGYKMADRQKGLDFEHSALVVRSLAKFHALAAVVRERGDLNPHNYDRSILISDPETMETFFKNSFEDLAKVMETKWRGEWAQYGKRLLKLSETLADRVVDSFRLDQRNFMTLNHGDCWLNNFMFRYNRRGEPVSLRFLDFQQCHYNHPGFDLQYLLQTSPDLSARQRKAELLREYHSSLEENLEAFGYGGGAPSLQQVEGYFRQAAHFGLSIGLGTLPIILIPPDRALDMEDFSEKMNKKEFVKFSLYDCEGEIFVKTLKFVIKEAVENGLL